LPDGKSEKFPIFTPTYGNKMIDIRSLNSKLGVFTLDPGFMSTGNCVSNITYINGEKGQLLFRGYKIDELAEKSC